MELVTYAFLLWGFITLAERYLCGKSWLVAIFVATGVILLTPVFGIGLLLWIWHLLRGCA